MRYSKSQVEPLFIRLRNCPSLRKAHTTISKLQVFLNVVGTYPLETLLNHATPDDFLEHWYHDAEVIVHNKIKRLIERSRGSGRYPTEHRLLDPTIDLDCLVFLPDYLLCKKIDVIIDRGYCDLTRAAA